jgi:hypothetical protein
MKQRRCLLPSLAWPVAFRARPTRQIGFGMFALLLETPGLHGQEIDSTKMHFPILKRNTLGLYVTECCSSHALANIVQFHSSGGHFLSEDVSRWDASFFNFTADMAKAMDPQVRLLLETTFEAFQAGTRINHFYSISRN